MRKLMVLIFAMSFSFALFAEGEMETETSQSIVEVAAADGGFSTLVAALEAAGLDETLRGDGPFTVFAPTDEAFAKLPEGTVEALLADIPALSNILLFHVVPGRVASSDVVELSSARSASGSAFNIVLSDSGLTVAGSSVVATDIEASNGIIHVVDEVMLPPSLDIVDTAVGNESFSTLVAALQAAGLVETLKGEGPFTVFAPTNEAFAKLPAGTVEALLKDIPALTDILLYHVVPGMVSADQVGGMTSATTASGKSFSIDANTEGVYVDNASVISTDIFAANGVIHVLDSVIIPN